MYRIANIEDLLHETGGCGTCCPHCLSGDQPQKTLLATDGVAANGKTVFDWNEAAAQLTRTGASWSGSLGAGTVVTYAFRGVAPSSIPGGAGGFQPFTAQQIIAAEAALQLWSDVSGITFQRVGSGTTGPGAYAEVATILFGNYTTEADPAAAFAYLPVNGTRSSNSVEGDIWVDFSESENANPVFGDYGPHVLAHEIGHAIGLSHPGTYNGGSPTYAADAEYWQDARMFTVMSYFGSSNTGGNVPSFAWGPQFHDIAAVQRLYGANMSTRTGDSVYGFNSNTDRGLFNITSASQGATFAVWDAGGVDTFDFSGYVENGEIDLRPGAFSSVGPTDATRGPAVYNVSIAVGVTIENAIGGAGNDSIIGNDASNTVHGGAGADRVTTGMGADNLFGEQGADRLNGGDGYALSAAGGSVYRLYIATLDRTPDVGGFSNWSGALSGGQSLASIATGFIQSAEFQQVYGALTNTQFVTLLYNNVLERAPDSQGLANWVNTLNSGTSRENVVLGFSESIEFQDKMEFAQIAFGTTVLYGAVDGQVFRLYSATLDRAPDEGGFLNWTAALVGGQTLLSIANGFLQSTEFQQVYGALNDQQFVTLLYNNVLNRQPDQPGLDGWIGLLNGGATRSSVVIGFSESPEFINLTAPQVVAFMQTSAPTLADQLDGGVDGDLLLGGRGADTFVFDRAVASNGDQVFGIEAFDTIQLIGFGYSGSTNLSSFMSVVGNDIVFSDQGQTITFLDTTLASVLSANFLFG